MQQPKGMPALEPGSAHVWWARCEPAAADAARLLTWLHPQEIERYHRFHFAQDRLSYLCAHALCRLMLTHFVGGPPADWRFEADARGRPYLTPPQLIDFNLSHTRGMVACGVVTGARLGVDLESAGRATNWRSLAPTVLSPGEIARLETLAPAAQAAAFLEYWTLKEAVTKSTGEGLGANFRELAINFGEGKPTTPGFHLALTRPEKYVLSAAVALPVPNPRIHWAPAPERWHAFG